MTVDDDARRTRTGRIVAAVSLAALVAVTGLLMARHARTFWLHHTGKTTTATVTGVTSHLRHGNRGRSTFYVYDGRVRFTPVGAETPVEATIGFGKHRPSPGDAVRVTYDPKRPARVQRRSLGVLPIDLVSTIFLVVTLAVAVLVWAQWRALRRMRRSADAGEV